MKITQIRSATIIIEWDKIRLLVDPMLASKGSMIPFRLATLTPRMNPIIDLPDNAAEQLDSVTHALITHCQMGHFDHLDKSGVRLLRDKNITVFCSSRDSKYLKRKGLNVNNLQNIENNFFDGSIRLVPCIHGYGWIAKTMENGVGYLISISSQPSVYILGDTILTDDVRTIIEDEKPDIIIVPAGRAKLDIGRPILPEPEEIIEIGKMANGIVIANHMDALDHCTVSRTELRKLINKEGLEKVILVPEDGETINI